MSDKTKAKMLLQYGDNVIDVDTLPKANVENFEVNRIERFDTFESRFIDNREFISIKMTLNFTGYVEDLQYLNGLKKCCILPIREHN